MAQLKFQILVDDKGVHVVDRFGKKVDAVARKGGQDFGRLGKDVSGMNQHLMVATSSLLKLVAVAGGLAGVYMGIRKLADVTKDVVSEAQAQEQAEKRLEAVLTATGQAAGFNLEQMTAMASAYQGVTTVGDEVIANGQAILLSFKQIRGEGFERATMAALDMSEVMDQDLKTSILQIGKALNDPIANLGALGRAGVQFTAEQKETIKTLWQMGDAASAQAIILKELESEFGGAAKAATETFGGGLKQARNALSDVKEELGFVITKNEFFIELTHLAKETFEEWAVAIQGNRSDLQAMAKSGVLVVADAFIVATQAVRAFHWTLSHVFVTLESIDNVTHKALGKILGWVPGLGDYLEGVVQSTEKSIDATITTYLKAEKLYNATIKGIEGLRQKIAAIEPGLADAGNAGRKAGEEIADGMDQAAGATDRAALAMRGLLGESQRLYEELYQATGWEDYAEKAIAAHGKILDADEAKWTKILDNADEAAILRARKEEDYLRSLYGVLDETVEAEAETARERVRIVEDMTRRRIGLETQAAVAAQQQSAMTTQVTRYYTTVLGNRQYISRDEYLRLQQLDELREITKNTGDLSDWSLRQEQRDIERANAEKQRLYTQFWQDQGGFADTMLDASQTLGDFIHGLQLSASAPASSLGLFGTRYQGLFESAFGDQERLQKFLSFIPDYLQAEQQYGGNYGGIFQSVLDDLEALQAHYETMGWLADLGIGDTASEINRLIDAFAALGISTEALRAAAETAAGNDGVHGLGQGLTDTRLPFQNVIDALGTMTGTTETKLIAIADMWQTMVTGIGGSMDSISGAIGDVYELAQANPTITYTPTVVHGAWSKSIDALGHILWYGRYPGQPDIGPIYSPTMPPDPPEWVIYGPPAQAGGLWTGNKGGEWFVPTYEPERGKFLRDVGADPEKIATSVARRMGAGPITVQLVLDGRVLAQTTTDAMDRHPMLINKIRELM